MYDYTLQKEQTALHLTSQQGQVLMVEMLLKFQADIYAVDKVRTYVASCMHMNLIFCIILYRMDTLLYTLLLRMTIF